MNYEQKAQLKKSIEKIIGQAITDAQLEGIIRRYSRSFKTGEEVLVESIANETGLSTISVRTKVASSDDTNRVKNDIVNIINQGRGK